MTITILIKMKRALMVGAQFAMIMMIIENNYDENYFSFDNGVDGD